MRQWGTQPHILWTRLSTSRLLVTVGDNTLTIAETGGLIKLLHTSDILRQQKLILLVDERQMLTAAEWGTVSAGSGEISDGRWLGKLEPLGMWRSCLEFSFVIYFYNAVSILQVMKVYRWSRCMALLILNLGVSRRKAWQRIPVGLRCVPSNWTCKILLQTAFINSVSNKESTAYFSVHFHNGRLTFESLYIAFTT